MYLHVFPFCVSCVILAHCNELALHNPIKHDSSHSPLARGRLDWICRLHQAAVKGNSSTWSAAAAAGIQRQLIAW